MSASRSIGRTVLTFGLCLLAFSFAMEAKLAWYGPQIGIGNDVSAAKALPEDVPDMDLYGFQMPDPVSSRLFCILILSLAASCCLITTAFQWEDTQNGHRAFPSSRYFSSNLFFRPPPIL